MSPWRSAAEANCSTDGLERKEVAAAHLWCFLSPKVEVGMLLQDSWGVLERWMICSHTFWISFDSFSISQGLLRIVLLAHVLNLFHCFVFILVIISPSWGLCPIFIPSPKKCSFPPEESLVLLSIFAFSPPLLPFCGTCALNSWLPIVKKIVMVFISLLHSRSLLLNTGLK